MFVVYFKPVCILVGNRVGLLESAG